MRELFCFLIPRCVRVSGAPARMVSGPGGNWPRFVSAGSIGGVINGVCNSDVIGVLPRYAVAEQLESASLYELSVRESPPEVFVGLTVQRPAAFETSPLHEIIVQIETALACLNSRRANLGAAEITLDGDQ